jgi:uncharacterized protein involved in exopolysaccharide biosynthesis
MVPSEYTPTGDEQGKFSPADILFKYLAFLPLFILSLAISIALGIAYLRYTTPVYESSVQMLVKSGERNPVYGGEGDVVERALYGPRDINMSNEIQKLRNIDVVARTVEKNNFHIQYFMEGSIKTSNVFNSLPYVFVPIAITDSAQTYRVRFTNITRTGYTLLLDEEKQLKLRWEDEFSIKNSRFKLASKLTTENLSDEGSRFIATWSNPKVRAGEILGQTGIYVADPNTTILSFSMRTDNVAMGRAILDAMVKEYIVYSVETKNVASFGTLEFIDIRLDSLSKELREIEQGLQDYRAENEVLSIDMQTDRYASLFTAAQDRLVDLEWELEILGYFDAYARSPRPRTDLVPSAMGLKDDIIPATVATYNQLRLQRERDAREMGPNSLQLKQLDQQIGDLQKTLFERIREHRLGI